MSSKSQTDTDQSDTRFTSAPSPWRKYKRRSDNKEVAARLCPGHRLMEIREFQEENFHCPECKTLLSSGNGNEFPDTFLAPSVFHERHSPMDDSRP